MRHPIETLWREVGLPEYFLGNDGSNTKLYALYDAILAGSSERIAVVQGDLDRESKAAESYHAFWIEERSKRIAAEADRKELSDALLTFRPLGGSECFVRRGRDETETYIADAKFFVPAIKSDVEKYRKTITAKIKAENALREIDDIVHVPTKDTMFRGAQQHFQSDFDRIRRLTSPYRASVSGSTEGGK